MYIPAPWARSAAAELGISEESVWLSEWIMPSTWSEDKKNVLLYVDTQYLFVCLYFWLSAVSQCVCVCVYVCVCVCLYVFF